jgi:hypothetical protein
MKKTVFIFLAFLMTGFVFGQTKTEIKTSDLPKSISDYISKQMSGYSINKAFKVVDKGVQTYDVLVKNGNVKHSVAFDKDGKFLKKNDKEVKEAGAKVEEQVKTTAPVAPSTQTPATTQPKKK